MWRVITLQSGLRLNTAFGVPILIHPGWLLFWALVGWLIAIEVAPIAYPEQGSPARWLRALWTNALFFCSVALHELAHLLVAACLRLPLQRVVLFPFGGVRTRERSEPSWQGELFLAAAGPLASLAVGILLFWAAPPGAQPVATWLGFFNLALALVNLLPAEPLDGAGILRAIGRKRRANSARLTLFSFRVADTIGTVLVWLGLPLVVITGHVEGLLLILFGCLFQLANNVYRVKENPLHVHLLRRTAVGKAVAKSISSGLSFSGNHQGTPFPATLPPHPLLAVSASLAQKSAISSPFPGDGTTLSTADQPPLAPWSVPAGATLLEALDRLDRPEAPGHLFVVEEYQIVGVCSRADLLHYLSPSLPSVST